AFVLPRPGGAGSDPATGAEGAADLEASAADARLHDRFASNLAWLAPRVAATEIAVAFPEALTPGGREAVVRRLGVLRSLQIHSIRALEALSEGRPEAAIASARTALDLEPGDAAARSIGARALSRKADQALSRGARGVAADAYERALELAGSEVGALTALAWIRHEQGSAGAAEDLIRRALAASPRTALLHYRLGILRLEAGDLAAAEASLLRAYDLDPRE